MTKKTLMVALALSILCASRGIAEPIQKSRDGVALGGFDAVAYFTDGKAVAGKADLHHSWKGAEWHFASADDRDRFAADPGKYAPQYGGHCAWGMAQDHLQNGDPEVWKIVGGKLYLFINQDAREQWEKGLPATLSQGDQAWAPYTGP
ncbi:MAG TPA: YHS domain-containing (seleno)protein [Thermoanaerobaculia bacterium]|nr:YHS domain-containing (seleno)protein [Thermoanaerobaculia bacterium]